jgi:hypothetical protein
LPVGVVVPPVQLGAGWQLHGLGHTNLPTKKPTNNPIQNHLKMRLGSALMYWSH